MNHLRLNEPKSGRSLESLERGLGSIRLNDDVVKNVARKNDVCGENVTEKYRQFLTSVTKKQ